MRDLTDSPDRRKASASVDTLRLEILREAREQYEALKNAKHANAAERQLYALKEMECSAMIRELLQPEGP